MNPYRPNPQPETPSATDAGPSTWTRNILSTLSIAFAYVSFTLAFQAAGRLLPSQATSLLFAASLLVSTWSNFHVAARIGLRQGGVPVMFILVFGWAAAYFLVAMLGAIAFGSLLYSS